MGTAPPPDRETDASTDELLDIGARRQPGRRWWWLVLVVGVAAPLVIVSLRHAASRTSGAAPSPRPSTVAASTVTTSAVAPSMLAPSTLAPGTLAPGSPVRPRAPCRGIGRCVVRSDVPPGIAALVRRHLSPDAVLHVRTYLVAGSRNQPTRLVERDLDAYFRSATVVIRVDRSSDVTSPLTPDPPGIGSLLLHRSNGGFQVRLQYLAPETVPPTVTDLLTVMTAPQLTST